MTSDHQNIDPSSAVPSGYFLTNKNIPVIAASDVIML